MASVPTTKPPHGFLPWWNTPPPYEADKVLIWREGYQEPKQINPRAKSPAWNVYGVYWSLVPTPPPPQKDGNVVPFVRSQP